MKGQKSPKNPTAVGMESGAAGTPAPHHGEARTVQEWTKPSEHPTESKGHAPDRSSKENINGNGTTKQTATWMTSESSPAWSGKDTRGSYHRQVGACKSRNFCELAGRRVHADQQVGNAETARTTGRTIMCAVAPDGEVFQGRGGRLPRDPRRKVPLLKAK